MTIRIEAPTAQTACTVSTLLQTQFREPEPVPTYNPGNIPIEVRIATREISNGWVYVSFVNDITRRLDDLPVFPVISDAALFQQYIQQWHRERGATSSITEMAMCRGYLRIIAMGPRVIPLVLRQMEDEGEEPDMWFVALQMLTGADPVTEEARGDFKAMADLWLDWAYINGYVW